MILRLPRASRSLHIPFMLPCIPDAYFLLVVVWKIVDRQPHKANAPPKSLFLLLFHLVAPNDGTTSPNAIQPGRTFSSHPLYRVSQQSVDCYVLPLNGDHLRTRPRLPLYFLIGLALAPQTREPTVVALPNPTARALRKPIGSGGTMSWWCRWPNHGGRELKPVKGRAAWLMFLAGCSYIRTLVQKEERGKCWPSPTRK